MISLLLPTRGRPDMLATMIESAYRLADHQQELFVKLYIDDDDKPTLDKVIELRKNNKNIEYLVGPRIALSETVNLLYKHLPTTEIIGLGGDDIRFETQGWDTLLINVFEKYPDRILLAYLDDGWIKHNFASHPFIHKNSIEILGHILPNYLYGEYQDTYLNEIYDLVGRKEKVDGVARHWHYSPGLRNADETDHDKFRRQAEHGSINKFHSERSIRESEAMKLLEFIKNYKE